MNSHGPIRRHPTQFKLRLCRDVRSGVIGRDDSHCIYNVLAHRIQLWPTQLERAALNDEAAEASLTARCESRVAALERMSAARHSILACRSIPLTHVSLDYVFDGAAGGGGASSASPRDRRFLRRQHGRRSRLQSRYPDPRLFYHGEKLRSHHGLGRIPSAGAARHRRPEWGLPIPAPTARARPNIRDYTPLRARCHFTHHPLTPQSHRYR